MKRILFAAALCFAISGTTSIAKQGEGGLPVVAKVYNTGGGVARIPTLVPGELPNEVLFLATIDMQSGCGAFGKLQDNFMTEVVTTLNVKVAGEYAFRLISDDGSKLWIDDHLVVDHDGFHGPTAKEGTVELSSGSHSIRVLHFEAGGGEQLTLHWRPPGSEGEDSFELIPPDFLSRPAGVSLATSPGVKRIIKPLRVGLPGDGAPLEGMHPGFDIQRVERIGPRSLSAIVIHECQMPDDSSVKAVYTDDLLDSAKLMNLSPSRKESLCAWLPPGCGADFPTVPALLPGSDSGRQLLVGDAKSSRIKRVFLDRLSDGTVQGCVVRSCGAIGDKGLDLGGASSGKFAVVIKHLSEVNVPADILVANGKTVFEVDFVRAMSNGMEITFTHSLDSRVGWDPESYYVEQWMPGIIEGDSRPTRDGKRIEVKSASVHGEDRKRVFLEIDRLREGGLVYLRMLAPCLSAKGEKLWSTEAWYTLKRIPTDRKGTVAKRPVGERQNVLTDAERAGGWELLFDGKTSSGWVGFGRDSFPEGAWVIRDGCIIRNGPGGDIMTVEEFDNFELKLEWRICEGGNSGVFYRVDSKLNWAWQSGPEMQVLDNAEHHDGGSGLTSAGSNYALHAPVKDMTEPVGLFNKARIVVNGNHVEHWLNGVRVVEYELNSDEWKKLVAQSKFSSMPDYGTRSKGHIVLQDHGDRVWYRNIKVRRLSPSMGKASN